MDAEQNTGDLGPRKNGPSRLATYLFPPLGLIPLFRNPPKVGAIISQLLFIGLYSILYAGLIGFVFVQIGIVHVVIDGSGLPWLSTRHARTDFD
ncbi:MAG: hypothetical protein ACPGVU_24620, partial [Limisphaerales bacterium]